jgi:phage-related protein
MPKLASRCEIENEATRMDRQFQKKSKSGIATPKQDIELIENRLKVAQEHHQANYEN